MNHDQKCEWQGEEPSACDCKVRILESQLAAAKELSKHAIGCACFHSLTTKDCDYCALRQELAAAQDKTELCTEKNDQLEELLAATKADIDKLKEDYQKLDCEFDIDHSELESENKRLRAALENFSEMRKSVDDTYNGGYHEKETNHAFHHGMMTVFNVYDAFAQAALDGGKA